MSFYYTAYGLIIQSYLPLPELVSIRGDEVDRPDVVIRRGHCDIPDEAVQNERYACRQNGVVSYYWRSVGTFSLKADEITVEPEQGVADDLLRPFLLGPILAVLLSLQGLLVLHCSAVAMHNRNGVPGAVAFLGHSGAGKSTLASALARQGHAVVADDIIAVPALRDQSENWLQDSSPLLIHSGPPYLKLRPPALENFGEVREQLVRWHPDEDSYVVGHEFELPNPLPLHSLYLLETAGQINIQRVEPQEAVMAIANHSCVAVRSEAQENARNFFQCSWLTTQIPIFRLRRPHDFSLLTTVIERIEKCQLSI